MAISIEHEPRPNWRRQLQDLPVGSKLALGFAALTLLLVQVVTCLFVTVAALGRANHSIVNVAAARSELSDHLRFAAADLRAAQQAYVLDAPLARSEFDQAATRFEDTLAEVRASVDDPVEEALLKKIATGYQTFLATDQLIWQAKQDGNTELARNLTIGAESLAFGFMAEDSEKLAQLSDEDRVRAEATFNRTSTQARTIGIELSAAAIIVMLVASWLITRMIRNPLSRVQLAAERAAEGDLSAAADVDTDDETGRLARAFNTMLAKLRQREDALLEDHHRQELQTRVYKALEMADDEVAALDVVARALHEWLPGRSAEMLLADNSKANLEQAVVAGPDPDGPGCPVASPYSCVAVRSGSPLAFPTSEAIDACPHLRDRGGEPCSAICVPVTFMGRAMGVIHSVGENGRATESNELETMSALSAQVGARIGMLRAMTKTNMQASTDSLTGLMNRRTFQSRIRALRRTNQPFTLVMADLDHFKRLNDTFGHEMGDRALTTFCQVSKAVLRHEDLMARWGGEEFAFALVGVDADTAKVVLDRIRLELGARLSTSDIPAFTASFGAVDAHDCATLEEAIRLADDALYEAKGNGRNQVKVVELDPDRPAVSVPVARVAERVMTAHGGGVLAAMVADDDPTEL